MTVEQITEQDAINNLVVSSANNELEYFNDDLSYMISHKFDVNAVDEDGDTALCVAVSQGHIEIVNILLKHEGIDVNKKDNDGEAPLHYACMSHNIQLLNLLLERKDIDLNCINLDEKLTPLEMSIAIDDLEEVADLLIKDKRTNVNAISANGSTMLIVSILLSRTKIVKALLNNPLIEVNKEVAPSMNLMDEEMDRGKLILDDLLSGPENSNVKIIEASNGVENEAIAGSGTALGMAIVMGDPDLVKLVCSHKEIEISEVALATAKFFGNADIIDILNK